MRTQSFTRLMWRCRRLPQSHEVYEIMPEGAETERPVVLQVSNADKIAAERLSCVFSLPIEKAVDELNLAKKIISCHPSNLPLPDHVDCFVALNRSPSRLEFSEALLGIHSTFDGSMILFENVVQVLHRPVPTAGA